MIRSNEIIPFVTVSETLIPFVRLALHAHVTFRLGYGIGFTGTLKDSLKDDLKLSKSQYSFFSAVLNIGAILGSLVGGLLVQSGRRRFAKL
jgi:hypothetical protein